MISTRDLSQLPDAGALRRLLIESVPPEFSACLRQPAFDVPDTTFCVWRRYEDSAWQRGAVGFPPGPAPDGSGLLLSPLDGRPETYREWAAEYFDKPFLTADMVRHVYQHRPLTDDRVGALTPDVEPDSGESRV